MSDTTEAKQPLSETLSQPNSAKDGSSSPVQDNTITWDGKNDPENPLNWSSKKRWAHIVVVALLGLMPNMGTTMCVPGFRSIVVELAVSNEVVRTLAITIYLLGLALGPLLLASLSTIVGRLVLYHVGNVIFLLFLIGNALSQTTAQFVVFRFLSAFAGGLPLALGGGTIADITPAAERGLATALFSLGPLAGPVLGPVIGGFLDEGRGWRWTFWLLAILAATVELLTIIVMRETSSNRILERKAVRSRDRHPYRHIAPAEQASPQRLIVQAVASSTRLLFESPVVLALSTYAALVFGVMYLLFTTFDGVFQGQYGFSYSTAGLAYLGMGTALVCGVAIFGKLQHVRGTPEKRLLPMIWFSPCVALGLFLYGWSAQYRVHWIAPELGTFLIGLGGYFVLMPSQLYLIELFGPAAPAALSANNLLRYVGGVFLPLAGPGLYNTLGYGWGNTLLGCLASAFVLVPILLFNYGGRLRAQRQV